MNPRRGSDQVASPAACAGTSRAGGGASVVERCFSCEHQPRVFDPEVQRRELSTPLILRPSMARIEVAAEANQLVGNGISHRHENWNRSRSMSVDTPG
jgi:hypothetical protein